MNASRISCRVISAATEVRNNINSRFKFSEFEYEAVAVDSDLAGEQSLSSILAR